MLAEVARWSTTPYSVAAADAVARELGLSPTTATILVRRGYDTPEAARRFLAADERHDALALGQMVEACEVMLRHVTAGSPIVVHGDYDVDGVSSTAILVRALRRLGARVSWHLPSRLDDGYGLSRATVERLAADGAGLLVTVDCAITAVEEVAHALELGLDVVVTDHHRPRDELPECPLVHPALGDYPFPDLCAAGVAHKVAEALYAAAGLDPGLAEEDLDLVALATVADVVALRGENRRLVRAGLEAMKRTAKPGLRALMRVSALDPGDLDARALGFRLAPRLNAAGRLHRADAALELLLTEDDERAAQVADELDLMNRERQDTETRILFAAEAARAEQEGAHAYVLAGEGWHPGVIGIVASRLVERHHRPVMMVALEGDGGRGSGRSIAAYDLHAGLAACSDHLVRFGGHRAAAGFEIEASAIDPFRRAIVAHAASMLTPHDLVPEQRVDALVPGSALGLELAEELERLGPFGHGNLEPTLLVPAAKIGDVRAMGDEGQHACFTLTNGGRRARGVVFRTTPAALQAAAGDGRHDATVKLELNRWNGTVEARVELQALNTRDGADLRVLGDDEPYLARVETELTALGEAAIAPNPETRDPRPETRRTRDRRGEGFAGVAGDLLSSGEPVLVVCADVSRRREALGLVMGGLGHTALVSWQTLASRPELAEDFPHAIALDPPPSLEGIELLRGAPPSGFVHLAWGEPEVEFALAHAQAELDLRPALAELYRGLRAADGAAAGPQLEALLAGSGGHPRSPAMAARMLTVLHELGLASYADGRCTLIAGHRVELERSATYGACQKLLDGARRYLATAAEPLPAAA
jgi:single-stranded-DNA-specific exonuclease